MTNKVDTYKLLMDQVAEKGSIIIDDSIYEKMFAIGIRKGDTEKTWGYALQDANQTHMEKILIDNGRTAPTYLMSWWEEFAVTSDCYLGIDSRTFNNSEEIVFGITGRESYNEVLSMFDRWKQDDGTLVGTDLTIAEILRGGGFKLTFNTTLNRFNYIKAFSKRWRFEDGQYITTNYTWSIDENDNLTLIKSQDCINQRAKFPNTPNPVICGDRFINEWNTAATIYNGIFDNVMMTPKFLERTTHVHGFLFVFITERVDVERTPLFPPLS